MGKLRIGETVPTYLGDIFRIIVVSEEPLQPCKVVVKAVVVRCWKNQMNKVTRYKDSATHILEMFVGILFREIMKKLAPFTVLIFTNM